MNATRVPNMGTQDEPAQCVLSRPVLRIVCLVLTVIVVSGATRGEKGSPDVLPSRAWQLNRSTFSAKKGDLMVFIGDSLDRGLVEEQCRKHKVVPKGLDSNLTCRKCIRCQMSGGTLLANIMLFGTGINNKWHIDSAWSDDDIRLPTERISCMLPPLLEKSSSFRRVIVSVNMFLWDAKAGDDVRFIDGSWSASVYETMILTKQLVEPISHAQVVWRTAPYNLATTAVLARGANSIARMACCAAGIRIVDWEQLTNNATFSNNELIDHVHYETYDRFWALYASQNDIIGELPCTRSNLQRRFNLTAAIADDAHHITA